MKGTKVRSWSGLPGRCDNPCRALPGGEAPWVETLNKGSGNKLGGKLLRVGPEGAKAGTSSEGTQRPKGVEPLRDGGRKC